MTVSILIAVGNWNNNLSECLQHCLKLDYDDFEIIVLPDSAFAYAEPRVRVLPTGSVSPPLKRDRGAREARGEVLAFIDDDAYPRQDWLRQAMPHFNDPRVAAVCGPGVTPEEDGLRQKASGLVYASVAVSSRFVYRYLQRPPREVDDYPSCNFIVRKSVFEEIGGFDTNFWPGEDTILCLQIAKKLKKKIIYDPKVVVYHHRRPLFKPHWRQVENYALHRGYFVKHFPQTSLRLTYFLPSLLFVGFLGLLILGFFSPSAFRLLAIGGVLYIILVSIFSISKGIRLTFLVFCGIISTHFVYGLFFLKGLFKRHLEK